MENLSGGNAENADLGALENLARAADAGAAAPGGPSSPAAAMPDPAAAEKQQAISKAGAEISSLLVMIKTVIAPMLPTVAAIYDQETCDRAGEAAGAVCVKHGWTVGPLKFAEEIAALGVFVPLAIGTYQAVQVDLARIREQMRMMQAASAAPPDAGAPGAPGAVAGEAAASPKSAMDIAS